MKDQALKNKILTTPVALIVFNRPQYVEQCFDAIRKIRPAKLFIIADGPRNDIEKKKTDIVRGIVGKVDWPCEVFKNYSEKNLGTRERISSGLNWVFGQTEQAIILEEDCIADPSFFFYCQSLLEKYKDEPKVMMISGNNFVRTLDLPYSYDFSQYISIWGWATWRRAWQQYDSAMKDWPKLKNDNWLSHFYGHGRFRKYLTNLFDQAYYQNLDSWATRWYYTCLRAGGFCIIPKVNLVSNIGVDGVHTSSRVNNVPTRSIDADHLVGPKEIAPQSTYDQTFFEMYYPWKLPSMRIFVLKLLVKIKRVFRKLGLVK